MLDFPNSPTVGQQYTLGDKTWQWNGVAWDAVNPYATKAELAAGSGASLVTFTQAGVGAVPQDMQKVLREHISAKQFGVVGNGIADDWPGFKLACAAAVARHLPLDIRGLKLYLATQDAPVPSEGLFLIGSGLPNVPVNWDYMTGINDQFGVIQSAINAQAGTAIISRYNGTIFSGKTLGGDNFIVVGDPSKANSCGFDTGVPTAYPGWSAPLRGLSNFRAYYFGQHGIRCQGGIEVSSLRNLGASFCNGYCLYVHRTAGINSPIEYLDIAQGEFTYGLLGNIWLDGVKKQVSIGRKTMLNAPGQLPRRVAAGFTVAAESDIVYPVRISKDPGSTVASLVSVTDCYAEEAQAIAVFDGGLFSDLRVEKNYLIPENIAWPFYHAAFRTQAFNVKTTGNRSTAGARFYFTPGAHGGSASILLDELADGDNPVTFGGYTPTQSQLLPVLARAKNSGTLGDGTAATFTYSLATNFPITAAGFNVAGLFAAFLVTANFQSFSNDNIGAYLVFVTRLSSGNYTAIVQSTGTTTGFSAAPTVSAAGVLSLPLSANYRGAVTRLDMAALS